MKPKDIIAPNVRIAIKVVTNILLVAVSPMKNPSNMNAHTAIGGKIHMNAFMFLTPSRILPTSVRTDVIMSDPEKYMIRNAEAMTADHNNRRRDIECKEGKSPAPAFLPMRASPAKEKPSIK